MVLVTIKQGQLRGIVKKAEPSGKEYYSFLGIPYARPAIGLLRFKPPQPSYSWSGVRDASKEGEVCLQMDVTKGKITGSEDCLYLNVHIPQKPSEIEILKPVIVYVHGGAFTFGSGSVELYSPDYIINHDVIFVSFNYRLGVLGFLSIGTPDCPGNVGLKDQLMAFEWVKENIKDFGGDPNNITAMGQSCGATSIHYLTISPLSKDKDLFQKAIFSSGNALSIWNLDKTPLKSALQLGDILGYKQIDKRRLVKLLKSMSALKLVEASIKVVHQKVLDNPEYFVFYPFLPCIEEIKEGALLPDHPNKLLQTSRSIPIIYGFNSAEGIMIYEAHVLKYHREMMGTNGDIIIKAILPITDAEAVEVRDNVKNFYSLSDEITDDEMPQFVKVYSDFITVESSVKVVELLLQKNTPLYQYLFNYEGQRNVYKQAVAQLFHAPVEGATHADELGYLFPVHSLPTDQYTDDDLSVINKLTKFWTNFAKTGNPNSDDIDINWVPRKKDNFTIMHIDKIFKVEENLELKKRWEFWKDILDKYVYME